MKQSLWLQGLLWAEEYIQLGHFFEDDPSGIQTLEWELYHSGEFDLWDDGDFYIGVQDYIGHLKKLQLDKAKQDVQNGNTMNVDEFLEEL